MPPDSRWVIASPGNEGTHSSVFGRHGARRYRGWAMAFFAAFGQVAVRDAAEVGHSLRENCGRRSKPPVICMALRSVTALPEREPPRKTVRASRCAVLRLVPGSGINQ